MKRSRVIPNALASALGLLLLGLAASSAFALPQGFSETQIAVGLGSPTAMAFAPDGRLFVCVQGGQVRVVKNAALLPTPFVSLSVDTGGERGLLGIAFDPNFANNHFVYLYYTTASVPKHNQISRFTALGDVADPASETLIFRLDDLDDAQAHNGGAMHFGADGKLYVAVGENSKPLQAQSLDSLLGKVLRLNQDGSIPADNPFNTVAMGNRRAIWALGFRNPFTFAVQPSSGRIFINDVGQNNWEEIDEGFAGSNYGWPESEGPTSNPNHRSPVFSYAHSGGSIMGCAVTGGTFYNPAIAQFPAEYAGKYFFADFCGGWIRILDLTTGAVSDFAAGLPFPVDLQVGPEGSLYYLARGAGGFVAKIQFTQNATPTVTAHPSSQTVTVGQAAAFTVAATGANPLAYQWQRDGADIPGAMSPSYSLSPTSLSDTGAKFRARVSNAAGSTFSNEATLTVTSNRPPAGTISSPPDGTLYRAGDTITYTGSAQDPDEGTLPPSAFTWRVDFHHHTHAHPFVPDTTGSTVGAFTIPTTGETASDVWYRIYLTVTDSGGLTHTTFRDVLPRKASITITASSPGLQITLDGQPHTSPFTVTGVVGLKRTIGVASPQTLNGVSYQFSSWSDAGATIHEITTPDADVTYTANMSALPGTSSFQLAQAAYQIQENGRVLPLSVTRSGDLSTAASVDYAITDGSATDRSDYTTALGTLQFSPGEGAKVITLLVTDDGLVEGDKDLHLNLSNPAGGPLLGAPNAATVTIKEDDAFPSSANPIDDAETFVRQHYNDLLNREPDPDGLQFWTSQITACGTDAACREVRRIDVSGAFFLSIEFQQTGFFVHLLNGAGLGRLPRYREFLRDTQEIGRGVVVNAPGWEELLRSNQEAFLDRFVQRAEFLARYPAGLTPEQYVDNLNANNRNPLNGFERDYLVAGLRNGDLTRAQILRRVAEDWVFAQGEFNRSFVLMQYFGYLRRNPDDPPNNDFSGYNFWLDKLNFFNGNFVQAEMVKAFLRSTEYRQRFGHP